MIGVKISLPGFDVHTATPEQCVVHSKFDTFKISRRATPDHFGIIYITFNNNPSADVVTTLFSFNHGYQHRPSLMTFISTGVYGNQSTSGHVHMDVFDRAWIEANVTDTQFKIDVQGHGTTDFTGADLSGYPNTMIVRYYIFAEDGD